MELYILNELIELEGELPEVVNYVYKSLDELNHQIRYKVACWQDEFLGDEPVPQDDEVRFQVNDNGTANVIVHWSGGRGEEPISRLDYMDDDNNNCAEWIYDEVTAEFGNN